MGKIQEMCYARICSHIINVIDDMRCVQREVNAQFVQVEHFYMRDDNQTFICEG